jgi:hypothetical protein
MEDTDNDLREWKVKRWQQNANNTEEWISNTKVYSGVQKKRYVVIMSIPMFAKALKRVPIQTLSLQYPF